MTPKKTSPSPPPPPPPPPPPHSLRAPLNITPTNNNNNNSNNNNFRASNSPVIVPMKKREEETPAMPNSSPPEGGRGKATNDPVIIPAPMNNNNNNTSKTISSSSSPSATNKKDDNEVIVLEEEEEELPRSKLHKELMQIYNCYNANCLALEADPVKKDDWQNSKKYPGEVLCVKCSIVEKRQVAEEKKIEKEKKQAEASIPTTRGNATLKRPLPLPSLLSSEKHEGHKKNKHDKKVNAEDDEKETEEENTEESEDNVPLSELAKYIVPKNPPQKQQLTTVKPNKSKRKPQWLIDWYSEEWWGRGDKKKFKVYTYEELFNPDKKPKLSMDYLEGLEANIDASSKNPRFICVGALPKQTNFAYDRPPPPTRTDKKKKGLPEIHKIRSSQGTHAKPKYIRRVTLAELMDAKLIGAGLNVLSMEYRGKEYKANITKNRQIAFQGKSYNEPASFSLAVKRLASPELKFSNPWTHPGGVQYKDQNGTRQFLGTLREKFFAMIGRNDLVGLPKADSNRVNDVQTSKSRTITVTTSAKLSKAAQKSSSAKTARNVMLVSESQAAKKAMVPKLYKTPATDTSPAMSYSSSDHGIERDHGEKYDVEDDDVFVNKKKESVVHDDVVMTTDEAVEIAVNHRDGSLIYTTKKKKKNVVRPKSNFYKRFPELH